MDRGRLWGGQMGVDRRVARIRRQCGSQAGNREGVVAITEFGEFDDEGKGPREREMGDGSGA